MAQSTVSGRTQVSSHVAKPAPIACLSCRRKHQKCDAGFPACGRCRKAQTDCLYTPPRRGHRHASKVPPPAARIEPSASGWPAHESLSNGSDRIQLADWAIQESLVASESLCTLDVRHLMPL